jgi:hypothetical protein
MKTKAVALITAAIFLIVSCACSHSPKKPSSPAPREEISSSRDLHSASSASQEEAWWEKPEYQWIVPLLIVLGIGIAMGASIYIASGASGLNLAVKK